MPTGRFSTASWRPLAASLGLAAALAALPAPAGAALVCERLSNPEEANQADVVFTGVVERHYSDGEEPAAWTQPFLDRWPPWLPIPTQVAPGPGTPAVAVRASVVYKGELNQAETTVRLLGRTPLGSGTWTIFANRSDRFSLYTTECSGNVPAAIDPRAYGLPPGHAVSASAWWLALLTAAGAVLVALALGAAAVAGAHAFASRRRR